MQTKYGYIITKVKVREKTGVSVAEEPVRAQLWIQANENTDVCSTNSKWLKCVWKWAAITYQIKVLQVWFFFVCVEV